MQYYHGCRGNRMHTPTILVVGVGSLHIVRLAKGLLRKWVHRRQVTFTYIDSKIYKDPECSMMNNQATTEVPWYFQYWTIVLQRMVIVNCNQKMDLLNIIRRENWLLGLVIVFQHHAIFSVSTFISAGEKVRRAGFFLSLLSCHQEHLCTLPRCRRTTPWRRLVD